MKNKTSLPSFLSSFAPLWFWLTISLGVMVAFVTVFPALYPTEHPSWTKPFQQVLLCFLVLEMVINWMCIKYVTSAYSPSEGHRDEGCTCSDCNQINCYEGVELDLTEKRQSNGRYSVPVERGSSSAGEAQKRHTGSTGSTGYTGSMFLVHMVQDQISADDSGGRDSAGGSTAPSSVSRGMMYPYWSWKPCYTCQIRRPPRAHHCPLCNTCILRRDHHCFFTGTCVGHQNLRYFIVFNIWAASLTTHSIILCVQYALMDFGTRNSFFDLLLPVTVIRTALLYVNHMDLVFILVFYSCIWFWVTTVGFIIEQLKHVTMGLTDFEVSNKMKVINVGSRSQNIRGVFGSYWLLNLLLPMHWMFPSREDGIHWRYVRVKSDT